MKNLLGVVITLVCLNSFAEAEYWSIGSFNVLSNAMAEKNRISGITGLSVQVATFAVGDLSTYRLVVEKDLYPMVQREKIMDIGITPWSIAMDSDQLRVMKERSEEISADGMDYFLVVGGFRGKIRANQVLSRFESDGIGNLQIEEATVAAAPWYRVLHGPFDAPFDTVLADLRAYGVSDAWWVKREPEMVKEVDVEVDVATEQVSSGSAGQPSIALETPAMDPPEAPASKHELSPPKSGESYFDYCVKKANGLERAVYCKDESFGSLVVAEKAVLSTARIDMRSGTKALAEFCAARASLREREKYCVD